MDSKKGTNKVDAYVFISNLGMFDSQIGPTVILNESNVTVEWDNPLTDYTRHFKILPPKNAEEWDELDSAMYAMGEMIFHHFFSMTKDDYKTRMLVEREELVNRIEKLRLFCCSDNYTGINNVDRIELQEQLNAMQKYFEVLNRRILRIVGDEDYQED